MELFDLTWDAYSKDSEYLAEAVADWMLTKALPQSEDYPDGRVWKVQVSYGIIRLQGDDTEQEQFEQAGIDFREEGIYQMAEIDGHYLFDGEVWLDYEEGIWNIGVELTGSGTTSWINTAGGNNEAAEMVSDAFVEHYQDNIDVEVEDIIAEL